MVIRRFIGAICTLAAMAIAFVGSLIPTFSGFELRPVDRTPRSIFETRRAGLC